MLKFSILGKYTIITIKSYFNNLSEFFKNSIEFYCYQTINIIPFKSGNLK